MISVTFDQSGAPISATGGNYASHISKLKCGFMDRHGPFAHDRQDILPLSSPLIGGTYMFGSQLALDKRVFLSRILTNELLSDALSRPSCVDRLVKSTTLVPCSPGHY